MTRLQPKHARAAAPAGSPLSQELEAATARAQLNRFCSAHVCTAADVSEDGVHLHLPRVLQLMRNRGYEVSTPTKPQHQPKAREGLTAWTVHIRIPRVEFDVAFYTPSH